MPEDRRSGLLVAQSGRVKQDRRHFRGDASIRPMFLLKRSVKRKPEVQWALGDRQFFACGACHILAYAFLEKYPGRGFEAVWIKPAPGQIGNHVIATDGRLAFDYHGFSAWPHLLSHSVYKAQRLIPGWSYTLVRLPADVLISEAKSKTIDGLWLRGPEQYLHDALPRARAYLDRFQPPPGLKACPVGNDTTA
jgi:hypothetical protein